MNKLFTETQKESKLPFVIKKEFYPREDYSMGSLADKINKSGGKILLLWANFRHWHIVTKY